MDEKVSSGQGWTDRDKLAYLYVLIDSGNAKPINWNNVPLPGGRTAIACKRMFQKLGAQLKDDIEGLKLGTNTPKDDENGEAGTKTPNTKSPRKKIEPKAAEDKEDGGSEPTTPKTKSPRKKKQAADGEQPKTPTKRGRKPKADAEIGENDEGEVPSPLKKVKVEEEVYA
ncbi:hypothetical protein AOQ84DRAFT_219797 [Glonium stellatum]|uniref:Myb-like domain-containing protein n=1 Tax=Glonium stellatum TaxID=574774 RepID=A0A8E2F4I4_9PEZI|nr:hypothetical protein AOQ84DRAFT_219797 [Glonium stellatum]